MLQPAYVKDNPIMATMFHGFVLWLWDQEEAHAAFQKQTNTPPLVHPKNALESMIDEATGRAGAYVEAFTDWAIKTQWGEAEQGD